MATQTSSIYTETQDGRFEVAVWKEREEQRGIFAQVLDLRPYNRETVCRDVTVEFFALGEKATVTSEHSRHELRKLNTPIGWQCDCPAGLAGRKCYHVRAATAADRWSLAKLRAWRAEHPRPMEAEAVSRRAARW